MKKLLALVLLATALVAVQPAPAAQAAPVATLATTYTCETGQGSGSTGVTLRARLPKVARAGSVVGKRRINVSLVVPAELVAAMRQFGVRSVEGSAERAALRVGTKRVPVRRLRLPRTDVPASGPLVLRGSGRVAAFAVPAAGRYAVKVPKRLNADLTAYFASSSFDAAISCAVAPGAPTRLSTLRVRG